MSFYVIVDGLFIGNKLNDLGLSAINLAWPITAFIQSVGFAFGISAGIYITRLIGNNELIKAKKMKLTVLIYLLIIGLILGVIFYFSKRNILILFQAKGDTLKAAEEYITIILYGSIFQIMGLAMIPLMKNYGHVRIAMVASLAGTLVNFILDYILIFKFNYGLKGAAVASVIGQGVAFLICLIPYSLDIRGVCFDLQSFKELSLGSLAPFILSYSYSLIIILTNALCEIYGSDKACAAYTVLSYLLYVINASSQGIGDAIQPLFSYHSFKNEDKIVLKYLRKCLIISLSFCLVIILIFYFTKDLIGRLYGLSSEALNMYNTGLFYYSVGFVFISISKVLCSYFYSINKKIHANLLVISEPLVFTPLAYLIFVLPFKVNGLWIGFMVAQILLLIFAFILYFLSRRKKYEWSFDNRQGKEDDKPGCMS